MGKNRNNNDKTEVFMTSTGMMYGKRGNMIKLFGARQRIEDRKSFVNMLKGKTLSGDIDFSEMEFLDFYDSGLNERLYDWDPTGTKEPMFLRLQEEDEDYFEYDDDEDVLGDDDVIGMKLILINTETDEKSSLTVYRENLGQLLEIIYVLVHIGDGLLDKKLRHHRIGTVMGINKIFDAYTELLDDDDELESLRRRLFYTAGLIKGYCQEKAYTIDMMLDIIDDTHFDSMTVHESFDDEDGIEFNDEEDEDDDDDNWK